MHRRIVRASLLAGSGLLLLTLPGFSDSDFDISQQIGPNPVLPEPHESILPDLKVAPVIGWKDGETPTVSKDLVITAYAKDLANPRTVHTLPNGDVLVVQGKGPTDVNPSDRPKDVIRGWIMTIAHGDSRSQTTESNLITLLRDSKRNGQVDQRFDLLTGLNSPFGVAWYDNTLYVAATDAILVYPYHLGETKITAQPRVLTPLPGGPIDHHWTKDLVLSPDARFLYVSVGSNSNAAENGIEAEKGRAAIWQVDRQTGAARVFASGLRNPNGLMFHPQTGALWAVVNERDELGPNLVPDYLTSVKEGAFYGWPWSYYGQHVDPRIQPQRPDMVQKAIPPDYALSSHVAPLGMTFTNNSALPEEFKNGAFIGEHGSWNRPVFNGYKVVYVPFENGHPSGKAQDVVTGFLDGDKARGRPVGVGIDGTGALLIADDVGNTVWRVASANGSVTPQPVATDQVHVSAAAGNGNAAPQNPAAPAQGATESQPSGAQPDAGQNPVTTTGSIGNPPATGANPASNARNAPASPAQTQIAPATLPEGTVQIPKSPQQ